MAAQSIFGSDGGSAVPGGNITKPLIIALLALFASRYMSGGGSKPAAEPVPAPKIPEATPASNASPGSILDGLGALVKRFQEKGFGDTVNTWINDGADQGMASSDVTQVLGPDVVDELSQRTGLSRDQVVGELAKLLPNLVDQLTPDGRLPTHQEIQRLMG